MGVSFKKKKVKNMIMTTIPPLEFVVGLMMS